jgi:hypothetical protein
MEAAPRQPAPGRGRRFRARGAQGTARDGQRPSWWDSRCSRWLLASTGLALLAVAIVMMACGA